MKEIKLTQGQVALVDDSDYEYLSQWDWHATLHTNGYYAERSARVAERLLGSPKHIYMHVVVNKTPKGVLTDHINGNTLDNQKSNLRDASDLENGKNVRRHKDNTSGYKGVFPNHKRWMARIKVNGAMKYIGTYDTPLDAARAYNQAALQYHGKFANLNDL